MRMWLLFLVLLFLMVTPLSQPSRAGPHPMAADAKYLKDFEFIKETVAKKCPCLKKKDIDWKKVTAEHRSRFKDCDNDTDHVKNVMLLLAQVKDSHTDITRSAVGWKGLPSKFDGLYGGGLWMAWEEDFVILRGMMEGLHLQGAIPLGSALVSIDGEPVWAALAREKMRIKTWIGVSSDHSLFASLGNRFFPFNNQKKIELIFLTPEGKTKKADLYPWGPGGKAFYPSTATLPEGVEYQKGALSTFLDLPWSKKVGYLRITGSMDRATVQAFHQALDRLQGMEALLLDCRGMGGGGDGPAWEMAGRFYPEGVNNGINGRIEPSGTWQYDGPVVMLQDELEISSAETFTWAVSEPERVVSVGRITGGWGIIPRVFNCPSGLVDFRMGVTDRFTPIKRIQTEGIGWPPDVQVPYGPVFCAMDDPVRYVGLQVLRALHAGVPRKKAVELFGGLFQGKVAAFKKQAPKLSKGLKGWKPDALARQVEKNLEGRLKMEAALLTLEEASPPDALGAARRVALLAPAAKAAGLKSPLGRLEGASKKLKKEAAAQEALLKISEKSFTEADEAARKSYLSRHGKTKTGRFVKEHLWK